MNRIVSLFRLTLSFVIIIGLTFYVLDYSANKSRLNFDNPILTVSGGNGSKEDPFLIENEEQFISFRDSVNRGYVYSGCFFRQIADLDLKDYGTWTPIGEYGTGLWFGGYYDGNGHTISNLVCTIESGDLLNYDVGLFGGLNGTVIRLNSASPQNNRRAIIVP